MASLQESYNSGDSDWVSIDQGHWEAQTFTTGAGYSISSVKLKLFRHSSISPGTVYVTIRAVDGSSLPTGGDLASGTTDGSTLTTSTSGEWREITFGAPYALSIATEYSIVVVCDNVANFALKWRGVSAGSYGSGQRCNSADGSSWSGSARDNMFETWGDAGTVHSITGTSDAAFGADAEASVSWKVTGTSDMTFATPQADVGMRFTIAGTSDMQFGADGSVGAGWFVSGTSDPAFGADAQASVVWSVTGTSAIQFGADGVLTQCLWDAIVTQRSWDLSPVLGGLQVGDVPNHVAVNSAGLVTFLGTAGFTFGHIYNDAATIATVLTSQNTWYQSYDAGNAWTSGLSKNMTLEDGDIKIITPGYYLALWSMSMNFSASPGASQQVESGLMVDPDTGTYAIVAGGTAHRTLANSTDTGNAASMGVLDLGVDYKVGLGFNNNSSAGKTMHNEHASLILILIAGT